MQVEETVIAKGHENVLALHETTLEITKEKSLTKRGDCIVGVSADRSLEELSEEFKKLLQTKNSELEIILKVDGIKEVIKAKGNEALLLSHKGDMVIRKSSFICPRTLAVNANKAACDINSEMVKRLTNPETELEVTMRVKA